MEDGRVNVDHAGGRRRVESLVLSIVVAGLFSVSSRKSQFPQLGIEGRAGYARVALEQGEQTRPLSSQSMQVSFYLFVVVVPEKEFLVPLGGTQKLIHPTLASQFALRVSLLSPSPREPPM